MEDAAGGGFRSSFDSSAAIVFMNPHEWSANTVVGPDGSKPGPAVTISQRQQLIMIIRDEDYTSCKK